MPAANLTPDQLRGVLTALVVAADSGEWHSSTDCRVEGRAEECGLCQALKSARQLLGMEGARDAE
jgi:hypothetical protein